MTRLHRNLLACLLAAGSMATGTVQAASSSIDTRDAQALERDFGRASGDPYWVTRAVEPVPGPLAQAYERTTGWLTPAAHQPEPERYGRGGGYVGVDKFQALDWSLRSETSAAGGSGG